MHIKSAAGEGSEGNEEHVMRLEKGNTGYTVEGLAELCPVVKMIGLDI